MAQVSERLEEKIRELAGVVRPRDEYSLIHGELGPDHVLVDEQGDPPVGVRAITPMTSYPRENWPTTL
ncbi:MAG TPA: hypothetical protein VH164_13020 [Ktedonobacteraceae bacterium]|jgi:hypothetical protein|nr:hypothetical protein [Ktedonobacteraceae bacterium]